MPLQIPETSKMARSWWGIRYVPSTKYQVLYYRYLTTVSK
jgi:hypothetical protein